MFDKMKAHLETLKIDFKLSIKNLKIRHNDFN